MNQLELISRPDDAWCRLLICLRPPESIQQAIHDYLWLCHGLPEEGRTVAHRLHLTLLYCERLHIDQLGAIQGTLAQVRFEPLKLDDFVPAPWDNGVAALLPAATGPIESLRRQVRVAARRAGIQALSRSPETPHVTVARHRQRARPMPSLRMNWQCDAFEMVHSPAYPAPYVPIARYPSGT